MHLRGLLYNWCVAQRQDFKLFSGFFNKILKTKSTCFNRCFFSLNLTAWLYKYWLNSTFSLFGPSIVKNFTPFSQKGRKWTISLVGIPICWIPLSGSCDMLPSLKSQILKWGLLAQWLYWAKYLQAILACPAIFLPGHRRIFLLIVRIRTVYAVPLTAFFHFFEKSCLFHLNLFFP